jgi:hypothetical protein
MANQEHLDRLLKDGVDAWNKWKQQFRPIQPPDRQPDLSGANLSGANLNHVDLNCVNLSSANLSNAFLWGASLWGADLSYADLSSASINWADLSRANLSNADLRKATLSNANLSEAVLWGADLSHADLSTANLSNADLSGATLYSTNLNETTLIKTNFTNTTVKYCSIYGISAWDIQLDGAKQSDLTITPEDQPTITIDNLKVAQFIYLLLNNVEIREVIDTVARKAVLILGRFTPERKPVLDALKETLRTQGYVPILFDFDKPASRDLTGTISTLAHLARFIIVDLTDPSSAPHEVATVIPHTVVPVQPVILDGEREYSMFRDLKQRYHWVLPTYSYADQAHLLAMLKEHVIAPAERKAQELERR